MVILDKAMEVGCPQIRMKAMCGIVGLFLKDKSLEPRLGELLTEMLVTMTDRGPDSAGIAIYRNGQGENAKLTVQSSDPDADFEDLAADLGKEIGAEVKIERNYTQHRKSVG